MFASLQRSSFWIVNMQAIHGRNEHIVHNKVLVPNDGMSSKNRHDLSIIYKEREKRREKNDAQMKISHFEKY